MVYKADPFSSDANSIDWEFGKAEEVDAGSADVGMGLLAMASGCCDCKPASLCATVAFIIAEATAVSGVGMSVEGWWGGGAWTDGAAMWA